MKYIYNIYATDRKNKSVDLYIDVYMDKLSEVEECLNLYDLDYDYVSMKKITLDKNMMDYRNYEILYEKDNNGGFLK